jgi:hypothetical protein
VPPDGAGATVIFLREQTQTSSVNDVFCNDRRPPWLPAAGRWRQYVRTLLPFAIRHRVNLLVGRRLALPPPPDPHPAADQMTPTAPATAPAGAARPFGEAVTGAELQARLHSIENRLEAMQTAMVARDATIDEVRSVLATLRDAQEAQLQIARAAYDDLRPYREKLAAVRASADYAAAFDTPRPLVSVTVATWNASALLIERAVASVLRQTYDNWEMVIVGDGCTDDTGACLSALGDPRVRFFNFPYHGIYPSNPVHRWMVSGTLASNFAVGQARGQWIAPLDQDDEFAPHHIETLLGLARRTRSELAYGKIREVHPQLTSERFLYTFPPQLRQFGFQAAIFLSLLRFFEFDINAWVLNEPGDWNLMRRMLATGVLMAGVDEVVTDYHPTYRVAGEWDPASSRAVPSDNG